MIHVAYILDDVWVVGVFTDKQSMNITDYIDITDIEIPSAPPETWVFTDGKFVVDEEKLIEFNRQNMPTILPMDFDLLLDKNGLYDAVQELIKKDRSLYIAYTRAQYFSRTDPFIDQARIALGLTDEQVDELWIS